MKKKSEESQLTISQVMLPSHSNVAGHVFGGEILKLMDSVAYAVATKHAESNVVTARIDEIEFRKPVLIGTVVKCTGKVVYVGRSSMEVYINIEVDDIQRKKVCDNALSAYFTMVAVDEESNPREVPRLQLETEEEIDEFKKGLERYKQRKEKRQS